MLSIRLNYEIERQLDYLAMTSGQSKNQLVIAALEQFLKLQSLGSVPLEQKVQEASNETFMHNRQLEAEEWPKAAEVAEWARTGGIWSAKSNLSATPTGAIYGRNTVVGYIWPSFGTVSVISKHLAVNPSFGVAAYGYNITSFDDWKQHMAYYRAT